MKIHGNTWKYVKKLTVKKLTIWEASPISSEIGIRSPLSSWRAALRHLGSISNNIWINLIKSSYICQLNPAESAWIQFQELIFIRNRLFEHLLEPPGYLLGSHLVFELNLGIFDNHLKSILKQPGGCMGPAIAFAWFGWFSGIPIHQQISFWTHFGTSWTVFGNPLGIGSRFWTMW